MGKLSSPVRWMLALIFVYGGLASQAYAAPSLLTSAAGYTGPVLNLSSYAGSETFLGTPTTLSDGTTVSAFSTASYIGVDPFGVDFLSNGVSVNTPVIVSDLSAFNPVTLSFAAPVSSFGAQFNYIPDAFFGDDPILSAYDGAGGLIASYDLAILAPIFTPGGVNAFAFRGIDGGGALIASVMFSGAELTTAGGVPEPSSWLAMMLGVFAVGSGLRVMRRPRGVEASAG